MRHQVPDGAVKLEDLLSEFVECSREVRACGMVADDFGDSKSELAGGTEKAP